MTDRETTTPLGAPEHRVGVDGTAVRTSLAGTDAWLDVPPSDGEIDVEVGQLDAPRDAIRAFERLLSGDEMRRAERFAFARDRRRYVVGRGRLRELIGARIGIAPSAVAFVYGDRGKPALAPWLADSGLQFNVAHCDDVAVYAFAHGREVGVDVEAVHPIGDADAVVAHFFSEHEQAEYAALDARDRIQGFFNCWTRKEAFIKAQGDGLHYPLDQFDVSFAPGTPARILRVGTTPGDECGWMLQSFAAGPAVVGAVAVRRHAGEPLAVLTDRVVVRSALSVAASGAAR